MTGTLLLDMMKDSVRMGVQKQSEQRIFLWKYILAELGKLPASIANSRLI